MNTIKVISRYGDFFFFNMSLIKVETGYLHRETTSLLPSSFTLTFLMLLPEREYGRWTNTGAYYWWSQWEGSVSKPLYKPVKKRKRHKSTSASTPRFLTPRRAFGEISPFSSALLFFLQPVKRLGFDMPSLISCLFFFFVFRWQAGYASCCEVDVNQAREKNFKASRDSPLSRKAIIRN